VVVGKKELFIKDEDGFNQFLLQRTSEKEKIISDSGRAIEGERLVELMNGVIKFNGSLDKLSSKGYSNRFIEFLISYGATEKHLFMDKEFVDGLLKGLEENGFHVSDVHVEEEDGLYEFVVTEKRNGGQTCAVSWEFLSSPELRQVMSSSEEFLELKNGNYRLVGESDQEVMGDPKRLVEELVNRAKKGVTIQRYKGLGEMNPAQLWSTTMDPGRRTLLRVQIDDWVESDDIFTVLMGDKVEPRRDFIQNHALEVTELDI
jgi:DNA gyrase subunit B